MAFGSRWRLLDGYEIGDRSGGVDLGAAYEFPVTDRHDIFGWRVTTDLVFWLR
jgi:hypothetical protein